MFKSFKYYQMCFWHQMGCNVQYAAFNVNKEREREIILFNDALNTFYLVIWRQTHG